MVQMRVLPRLSLLLLGLLTTLASSSRTAHADRLAKRDEINYFVNPPASGPNADFAENVAFTLGSVIDLKWISSWSTVSLQLCQQDGTGSIFGCAQLFREQVASTVQWTVSLGGTGFDLSDGQVFYIQIYNGDFSSTDTFTSHYFNIQEGGRTTQSVVTATINPYAVAASSSSVAPIIQTFTMTADYTIVQAGVSQATSSPMSSSTTSGTSSPTASGTTKPKPKGLSEGAKIGIGVGVGVGGLCLILGVLIGFCLYRRGKRRSAQPAQPQDYQQAHTSYYGGSGHPSGLGTEPKYAPVQQQYEPHSELPAHSHPQELDSGRSPTQELPGSHPFQQDVK